MQRYIILLIFLISVGCNYNMKNVLPMKNITPVESSFRESDPLYLNMIRMLIAKGHYELALTQVKEIVKKYPKNPELYYLMGCAFREQKGFKEAYESFNKAISLAPKYAEAYDGLGITYDLEDNHSEAVTMYKKAISLNPGIARFYNNLGFSLYLQGELIKAIEAYQKALHIDPDNKRPYNNLGYAYGMQGEYEKAWQAFEKGGDIATAYNNMGFVYQMCGNLEKAKEMYEKALEIKPDFIKAYSNLKDVRRNIQASKIKENEKSEYFLKDTEQVSKKDHELKQAEMREEAGIEISGASYNKLKAIYGIKGDYERDYQKAKEGALHMEE